MSTYSTGHFILARIHLLIDFFLNIFKCFFCICVLFFVFQVRQVQTPFSWKTPLGGLSAFFEENGGTKGGYFFPPTAFQWGTAKTCYQSCEKNASTVPQLLCFCSVIALKGSSRPLSYQDGDAGRNSKPGLSCALNHLATRAPGSMHCGTPLYAGLGTKRNCEWPLSTNHWCSLKSDYNCLY